jgi:hypothetical protein
MNSKDVRISHNAQFLGILQCSFGGTKEGSLLMMLCHCRGLFITALYEKMLMYGNRKEKAVSYSK